MARKRYTTHRSSVTCGKQRFDWRKVKLSVFAALTGSCGVGVQPLTLSGCGLDRLLWVQSNTAACVRLIRLLMARK